MHINLALLAAAKHKRRMDRSREVITLTLVENAMNAFPRALEIMISINAICLFSPIYYGIEDCLATVSARLRLCIIWLDGKSPGAIWKKRQHGSVCVCDDYNKRDPAVLATYGRVQMARATESAEQGVYRIPGKKPASQPNQGS